MEEWKKRTDLLVAAVVPLILNDDGPLGVLVKDLLSQGVHLLAGLQGLLPQSHLPLLGLLCLILGIYTTYAFVSAKLVHVSL